MKVLQVIDSLPTGGGSRFLTDSIPEFIKQGIETDLLLLDGTETHFLKKLQEEKKCNIISLTKGNRWSIFNFFRLQKYFSKYDLIHVHIFPASYFVAIANFLSFKKNKIIFTEHNSQNRRAKHFLFRYLEKFIYSNFTVIVCLSYQVKKFIKENLNTKDEKLVIIENGINLEQIKNAEAYSKKDLGYQEDDILLLMCARFEKQKDQTTLIKSLAILPENFKLLFAGEGSTINDCRKLVKEMNLGKRVRFLGNRDDVFRLMKTVDFIILSSHFEGLSLAALEALASGKVFIGSNVEGLDFVVKDAGILFEKGNDKELAEKISEINANNNLYQEIVEKSLMRAQKYDVINMVKNYKNLYQNEY